MTSGGHAIAINYHFVRPENASGRFRLRAHEKPERFAAQLDRLLHHVEFLTCSELVEQVPLGGRSKVLLTFDDGARDVSEFALPALRERSIAATAFVCSLPYAEEKLLQVQRVEFLMSKLGLGGLRDAFYAELERFMPQGVEREPLDFAGGYRFYRYDEGSMREFKLDLNYRLPYTVVEPVLESLFQAVFGRGAEQEAVRETYLAVDDLKRLCDAGVEIGTHTYSHKVLPRLAFTQQKEEIRLGAEGLQELLGAPVRTLAYPFHFHDEQTKRAARECGLVAGLAGGRRGIEASDLAAPWAIPRYDVNDCFDRRSNVPTEALRVLGLDPAPSGAS